MHRIFGVVERLFEEAVYLGAQFQPSKHHQRSH